MSTDVVADAGMTRDPVEPDGGQGDDDRPTVPDRARLVLEDALFLLSRVWFGAGAAALIAVGLLAALAVGAAFAFASVTVAPAGIAVLVVAWVLSRLIRPASPDGAERRTDRDLRHAAGRLAVATGGGLAAVVTWWLLGLRAMARRERTRLAGRVGHDLPIAYRPLPEGRLATLRALVADPATWRDLVHLVVVPASALAAVVLMGFLVAGGLALVLSPTQTGTSVVDEETWFAVTAGVGMLVLSPWVLDQLARGVTALGVASLSAGEGARMQAEVAEQRLRRQLAVDAAEHERRRIERDLHDGAQQRLVALGITLGLAREALPADPAAGADLVEEAHEQAKLALAELRDLARGIHPAILGDRGLDAALSDLLRRTPVPASIFVAVPTRPPSAVESAAYFVVSEALANVARHAEASRVTVSITQQGRNLVVEVIDDGIGGADPAGGTGLAGLAERVGALDGRFAVDSPSGGPTTIRAEMPCGS